MASSKLEPSNEYYNSRSSVMDRGYQIDIYTGVPGIESTQSPIAHSTQVKIESGSDTSTSTPDSSTKTLDVLASAAAFSRPIEVAKRPSKHKTDIQYLSDSTLPDDISDSDFLAFDPLNLDLDNQPPTKKRRRRSRKASKSKKVSKKDVELILGRECLYTDQSGDPVSIFTPGHPYRQIKFEKFATFNDILGIGELTNAIYKWWSISQFQWGGATEGSVHRLSRSCIAPPDPSFLRVCKKFREEATAEYYTDKITKCNGILFKDTKALYDFLTSSSKEEIQGLTAAWINYDANVVDLYNRPHPYRGPPFEHLDGSHIISYFVQIDIGPRYAFDAFELLRSKCPNLVALVIHRASLGAPLSDAYPGVWALRGLRRLQRFRFEGVARQWRAVNRAVRREVMRTGDRKVAEEQSEEANRLRLRDSEGSRRIVGWPCFVAGVPTLVRWY